MQCYATFMNRFPYAYLCVEVHVMHSYAAGLLCVICFMHVMQSLCILQVYLLLDGSYVFSFLCNVMHPRSYAVTTLCILCSHYVYPMRPLCHATSCELWPLQ